MKKIFLLSLIVTLLSAANLLQEMAVKTALYNRANKKCAITNSDVFDKFSKNNKLYELYQKNTFGGFLAYQCIDLGYNYRKNYIKILNENNISCTDKWCNNGMFKCFNKTKECYEVEHIVDRKNTPYNICNPNILGNVIMAYGKWNSQVGKLCWKDAMNEKIQVYGKDIFCTAIRNIIKCSNCSVKLPTECIEHETSDSYIFRHIEIIICTIIIVLLILMAVSVVNKYLRKENMRNMEIYTEDNYFELKIMK